MLLENICVYIYEDSEGSYNPQLQVVEVNCPDHNSSVILISILTFMWLIKKLHILQVGKQLETTLQVFIHDGSSTRWILLHFRSKGKYKVVEMLKD
jgi:hypothetical protein